MPHALLSSPWSRSFVSVPMTIGEGDIYINICGEHCVKIKSDSIAKNSSEQESWEKVFPSDMQRYGLANSDFSAC